MRDPELERVRVENRHRLGMAGTAPGLGFDFTSTALSAVGPITVGSAWPEVSYTYDPSRPAAAQPPSSNGWIADFVTKSIVRPYINVPSLGFSYNPGSDSPDYSGIASAVVGGAAVLGVGVVGWTLFRAFFPGARS